MQYLKKLLHPNQCEYVSQACSLFNPESFNCQQNSGKECGRHRHWKQLERTGHYA
jgi:hypothetical protein